jgi:hypothetical protein
MKSKEHLLRHNVYSGSHGHRRVEGCRLKLGYMLSNFQRARHRVSDILIPFDLRLIARLGSLGVSLLHELTKERLQKCMPRAVSCYGKLTASGDMRRPVGKMNEDTESLFRE